MDPLAASGAPADAALHDVDEGGDVVIGDPLPLVDGGDEGGVDDRRRDPDGRGVGGGTTPSSAQASVASISTSSHGRSGPRR